MGLKVNAGTAALPDKDDQFNVILKWVEYLGVVHANHNEAYVPQSLLSRKEADRFSQFP